MTAAFQQDAFQDNAFQTGGAAPVTVMSGSASRRAVPMRQPTRVQARGELIARPASISGSAWTNDDDLTLLET